MDMMKTWVGTTKSGQQVPVLTREEFVRQETQEEAKLFLSDLCRLNMDRERGVLTEEYPERVRARDLLVL